MSDAYATVDIPKSLPVHEIALTSTGRKIEHNKVVVVPKHPNRSDWFPSKRWDSLIFEVWPSCCNSTMSDAYASVHIPKSLPIHGLVTIIEHWPNALHCLFFALCLYGYFSGIFLVFALLIFHLQAQFLIWNVLMASSRSQQWVHWHKNIQYWESYILLVKKA